MKKIIGALIALMLCLLIAGCSGNSTTTTTTLSNVATTVTTQATVTTTQATAPTNPLIAPTSADVRLLGKTGFDPETVTIRVGGTVTWIVTTEAPTTTNINPGMESLNKVTYHVIASSDGKIRSGRLGPGDKFSYTFTEKGTYEYLNVLYGVHGKVIVE